MLGRFDRFFSTLTQMFQCDPQDICRNGPDAGTWQSGLDTLAEPVAPGELLYAYAERFEARRI
jgi:hypothetical protein